MNHKDWVSDNDGLIDFRQFEAARPKRLVEECCTIMIGAVRRRFGKQALLQSTLRSLADLSSPPARKKARKVVRFGDRHRSASFCMFGLSSARCETLLLRGIWLSTGFGTALPPMPQSGLLEPKLRWKQVLQARRETLSPIAAS
jgi:hypothetical protein